MYNEALSREGSFRKAAESLGITKSKFMVAWKKELGLCTRTTACRNIPEAGKTSCQQCLDRMMETIDKERAATYHKSYVKDNRQAVNNNRKIWYKDNHEKQREYQNNWAKKNPHVGSEKSARRRASKKEATPSWVNKDELKKIYKECPKGFHVDHIIPLVNDNVCGLHVPWNLQYLSELENDSKGNKFDGTYDNNTWRNELPK